MFIGHTIILHWVGFVNIWKYARVLQTGTGPLRGVNWHVVWIIFTFSLDYNYSIKKVGIVSVRIKIIFWILVEMSILVSNVKTTEAIMTKCTPNILFGPINARWFLKILKYQTLWKKLRLVLHFLLKTATKMF